MSLPGGLEALRKIVKTGSGLSVFITREARRLKLKKGDYVHVSTRKEGGEELIVLKKVDISKLMG
ncbi:hypothetical protein JW721_05270 [Candidatus Micrarchaeota archaeon]|nr:hypothetical protein [Candidatus Micrarchaeota archaeon]